MKVRRTEKNAQERYDKLAKSHVDDWKLSSDTKKGFHRITETFFRVFDSIIKKKDHISDIIRTLRLPFR